MSTGNKPLLVQGGRIVDPGSGYDGLGDVLICDGKIVARGDLSSAGGGDDVTVLNASGCIVSPGFVDLHTHLRFPGFPDKETIESGTAAAAAGGFTTVCAMANTMPVVDRVGVLHQVHAEIADHALVQVRQLAAVSLSLHGVEAVDFDALSHAGVPAFSDDGKPVWDEELMRVALRASHRLRKPISVHEEDRAIVGSGVANAGALARDLGLAEWPCAGEAAMIVRDLALLAQEGGHLHVAHVSCMESVEVLRAARQQGLNVTAEVTPHHLILTDTLLAGDEGLNLGPAHPCTKVNPPLRTASDIAALVQALSDGTIGAVATDHAPHAAADKALPFADAAFGFSAIELALPLVLELVHGGLLDLRTVIARLSTGPAKIFGLPGATLSPHAPADLCVFDPHERWTVTSGALRSLGKNTPLLGKELQGRVRFTIVAGALVHEV